MSNKKKDLLAAVRPRTLRPRSEVKTALEGRFPGGGLRHAGNQRERKWLPQLVSFRSQDVRRLDELLSSALRHGVRANKSQIVRAGLLALKGHADLAGLMKRLDQ